MLGGNTLLSNVNFSKQFSTYCTGHLSFLPHVTRFYMSTLFLMDPLISSTLRAILILY